MFRGWSFKCLSWGAKRYNISLSKGDGTKHKLVSGGGGGGAKYVYNYCHPQLNNGVVQ